jgi:hypothetical protein
LLLSAHSEKVAAGAWVPAPQAERGGSRVGMGVRAMLGGSVGWCEAER